MKHLPLLLFLIMVAACGLSKTEKNQLEFEIKMHNDKVSLNYRLDSLNEESSLKTMTRQNPKLIDSEYRRSHMSLFERSWNRPYDIKKDRFLTLESYLKYCEAHNYKPKEYIKFID